MPGRKFMMLTFHHVRVAESAKSLSGKHVAHHPSEAGVLEHALHASRAHQSPHEAPHAHPWHAPRVARHLLDYLEPRILPCLGLQKPGKILNAAMWIIIISLFRVATRNHDYVSIKGLVSIG